MREIELKVQYLQPIILNNCEYHYDTYYPMHLKDAIRLICGKRVYDELFDIKVSITSNEVPVLLDDAPITILEHKNGLWCISIGNKLYYYNEQTDFVFFKF